MKKNRVMIFNCFWFIWRLWFSGFVFQNPDSNLIQSCIWFTFEIYSVHLWWNALSKSHSYYFYRYLVFWLVLFGSIICIPFWSQRKTRTGKINIDQSFFRCWKKIMVWNNSSKRLWNNYFWIMVILWYVRLPLPWLATIEARRSSRIVDLPLNVWKNI